MLPIGKTIAGNIAIATAIALACAALSWFLVERPALRLRKRFVAGAPAASPIAGQD
jgi:peptidoglycan/LPS O-acetylase OafA/YrhL